MQPNAKSAKMLLSFLFSKISKTYNASKCKLSEFEQSKHITVNDSNRPYSNTIHPNRKKWHKTWTWWNYPIKD